MTTLLLKLPPIREPVETNFKSVNFPNGVILICREFDPFMAEKNPNATVDRVIAIDRWTTSTGSINDDGRMKAKLFPIQEIDPPLGIRYICENGCEVIAVVGTVSNSIHYLDEWEAKWITNEQYLQIKPEDTREYDIVSRFGWFLFNVTISQWSEDMTQIKLKNTVNGVETNWLDVANLRRSSW